jgi:hypothetical protein
MLWLARQPGRPLAERAGDDQRVMAVAREENFDTLENRVLRAYCELAHRHAREYLDRNRTRRQTRRARQVEAFGKRCKRGSRVSLPDAVYRLAEPGVTPNFVLQQNPLYHRIWTAWLRTHRPRAHEGRTLALAGHAAGRNSAPLPLVVALMGVRGRADLSRRSPLWFRDEHRRGRWIEADAPFAVVHLPASDLIVEVQTGARHGQARRPRRADLAAHRPSWRGSVGFSAAWRSGLCGAPWADLCHGEEDRARRQFLFRYGASDGL